MVFSVMEELHGRDADGYEDGGEGDGGDGGVGARGDPSDAPADAPTDAPTDDGDAAVYVTAHAFLVSCFEYFAKRRL